MMSHDLFTRKYKEEFGQIYKDSLVISDPDQIKRIKAKIKMEILGILKEKQNERGMTIKEISEIMKKNPGTIKYHIDELCEIGLLAIYSIEPTPTGIVQKFYRLTFKNLEIKISEKLF
jgi:predicted ArsR family transcriptional regulator